MEAEIASITEALFYEPPTFAQMRGNPGFRSWGEQVTALSELPGAEPFRPVLAALVASALTTLDPVNEFRTGQAEQIAPRAYLEATRIAVAAVDERPEGAYLLATMVFVGWTYAMREEIEQRPRYGTPAYAAWSEIPLACATACLAVGALLVGRRLIDLAYEALMMSATRAWYEPELRADLLRYRRLARRIQERIEHALSNLADDLRESCRPGEATFRAEVGAMLWSLGMLPESELFRPGTQFVPTRRLVRQLVRQSLDSMPYDPLVQYIWLAMKDRPPFNLREHVPLFGKINQLYHYHDQLLGPASLMLDGNPFELYAATLISWFRGELSADLAHAYFGTCHTLTLFPRDPDPHGVQFRYLQLGQRLLQEFEQVRSAEEDAALWRGMGEDSARMYRVLGLHPDVPETHVRLDGPLFRVLAHDRASGAAPEQSIVALEGLRASAQHYWLAVTPPLPPDAPPELAPLVERERQLIDELRGAYFLILMPILPQHYKYHSLEWSNLQVIEADRERYSLSPQNGRRQYREIEGRLAELYAEMEPLAPDYVRRRRSPVVSLAELAALMGPARAARTPPRP